MMRQKLSFLLKHNAILQRVYRIVVSSFFRLVGLFFTTDNKLILFVSFMGKAYNDSPRLIYEYIQKSPELQEYRCVWAFDNPERFPELQTVKIDTLHYFTTALKARYWITNTNIERGLRFKKQNQVYLNTWHGVALKTIGNDCPGRHDYRFDTVDYLVVSSKYEEKVMRSAFNARESSFLRCGMPRNEELWQSCEEDRLSKRRELGIGDDKKVILYAPTWRESTDGGRTYAIRPPISFNHWQEVLCDNYIVLFRAHHQTTSTLGVEFSDFARDYSEYPSINDLMIASDILITDYSAIAFDYSILCKPILCFAYDIDSYLVERGTYFEIDDEYPNKSCRTEEELLQRILTIDYIKESNNTRRFRDKFIQYHDNPIQKCIEVLFNHEA